MMKRLTKFLVVDDDSVFRERLVKALVARGLEARGAKSLETAIAAAREFPVQAAIVDMRMAGGGSGLDVVRELSDIVRGIQIVVLTGYGSIANAVEALRLGAINYLSKPVDTEQILAAFEVRDDGLDRAGSQAAPTKPANGTPSLARVEWEHIQRILHDCDGNVSMAAKRLGLHRRSLQRKLRKLAPVEWETDQQ